MNRMKCVHPDMMHKAYLFLLWLISKKGMHGYEIIKLLEKENIRAMGPNRLYPMLNHMLSEGMISQKEKKTGKRVRKIYIATANGKRMLKEGKQMFKGLLGQFVREMSS